MKKFYLLITIIILFCNSLYSQWAPIGAKWYYDHTIGSQQYLTVIESINDTLILNKQCKVLKTYTVYVLEISPGIHQWDTLDCPNQYTYFDSSKVYIYDFALNNFSLLYDFNAAVGDTITVKDTLFSGFCPDNIPCNLFQYKVNIVSDTLINGISLKKQNVSTTQNSDWFITDPYSPQGYYPIIIERIGAYKFLFGAGSFVEGSISHLRCYEDSSISYHSPDWPDSLACEYLYPLITNVNETENSYSKFNVFPNPANDYITFQFSKMLIKSPINIIIFDFNGRMIKSVDLSEGKIEYKMNTIYLNGLYFYMVTDYKNLLKKGYFIIKH